MSLNSDSFNKSTASSIFALTRKNHHLPLYRTRHNSPAQLINYALAKDKTLAKPESSRVLEIRAYTYLQSVFFSLFFFDQVVKEKDPSREKRAMRVCP